MFLYALLDISGSIVKSLSVGTGKFLDQLSYKSVNELQRFFCSEIKFFMLEKLNTVLDN